MSRTKRHTIVGSHTSPEIKNEQNRKARGDKRKLTGLTFDECLKYQELNIDGLELYGAVIEDTPETLDLGNDKKYKRQANQGFAYS